MADLPVVKYISTQDKTNTEKMQTYIHVPSRIRIHDLTVPAAEDSTFIGHTTAAID
jgi:hypothetical protein